MSFIDKLLQMDSKKITEMPEKEVEIERLSKMSGSKAVFVCKAIDGETHSDIQKMAIDISSKGKIRDMKMYDMKVHTILEGVKSPSFKDARLTEHFKAGTPKDLIKKMLLPGEIDTLYNAINELSGYEKDEDDEEEVKNS